MFGEPTKTAPLAVGELASDAEIADIPFRKGVTLYLKDHPEAQSPDFEVVYPTEETLAGVPFLAGSRIRLSVTRYKTLKRPDLIRIEGEMSRSTHIDGVVYASGRIALQATLNGPLMETPVVLEGFVESGAVPAATPILLARGIAFSELGPTSGLRTSFPPKSLAEQTARDFGPLLIAQRLFSLDRPLGTNQA